MSIGTKGSAEPVASIIVPVFNHWDETVACLAALAEWPSEIAHEVILVDDGSSDETALLAPHISGLRYHRRAENGGFIAATNDGAQRARGDFLVFLNNDTIPQPGWLDALVRTVRDQPRVGMAGAQLITRQGTLQEAGGIVYADGSATNYGRGADPDHPFFAFVREADYCSGAAIAIARDLFLNLGGFDTRYSPAYYEDTDLAFKVREAGLDVLLQPAARVVHDEGTTSGTDITSGVKAFQVRNQSVFASKWHATLAQQPSAGTDQQKAATFFRGRTILIVDAQTPAADRDSGSLRLVNLIRLLRDENAHVVFWPLDRHHRQDATQTLQQLGVEVWYSPYARSFRSWMKEHGRRFDTIVASRCNVAATVLPVARRFAPQARFVFDTVDLHFLREERVARATGSTALSRAAAGTRAIELRLASTSDVTLVVSEVEKRLLEQLTDAHVELLSNLHEVPGCENGFLSRSDVLFVGSYRHAPNIDAVKWFVSEVWPLVRAELPEVQFHCVGEDPDNTLSECASVPGVRLHGHIPDLTPLLRNVRVAIAPLRAGAGVKGKINLSMAHGQPVVATHMAVEGMHLRDGVDVLTADEAHAFAQAVLRLYGNEDLWLKLSSAGLDNVREHFSLESGREVVQRVLLNR